MPKLESWLWFMIIAIATACFIPFVPTSAQIPVAAVTGALLVVGLCILFVRYWPGREPGRTPPQSP